MVSMTDNLNSDEYLKVELPAINQLKKLGYQYMERNYTRSFR